ncbi:MAG: DUF4248 domain-containing protein, partial [Bacteroidales bacterium]|nr:DUF4248 domain-containing protein [Bacteroidales bacterium]
MQQAASFWLLAVSFWHYTLNTKHMIQSLTKSELAQLYFPGAPRSSALRLLHKYITSAHGLLPALERVGYQRASRRLTRRQVM